MLYAGGSPLYPQSYSTAIPRLRFRKNPLNLDTPQEGEKKGKEEKSRQIALKIRSAAFSIPEIARFTDLSPDAIEEPQSRDD